MLVFVFAVCDGETATDGTYQRAMASRAVERVTRELHRIQQSEVLVPSCQTSKRIATKSRYKYVYNFRDSSV